MIALTQDHLTEALKKSIEYEQSKTDVMNLVNHGRQDLSLMIEVIEDGRAAFENIIEYNKHTIDNAEDMEEGLQAKLRENIALDKAQLESLLAWRMLFLSAWNQVKR